MQPRRGAASIRFAPFCSPRLSGTTALPRPPGVFVLALAVVVAVANGFSATKAFAASRALNTRRARATPRAAMTAQISFAQDKAPKKARAAPAKERDSARWQLTTPPRAARRRLRS